MGHDVDWHREDHLDGEGNDDCGDDGKYGGDDDGINVDGGEGYRAVIFSWDAVQGLKVAQLWSKL